MNKIVGVLLVVLLVAAAVGNLVLYQNLAKVKGTAETLKTQVTTLEAEKETYQKNAKKALNYIKAMDLIIELMRPQIGLESKYKLNEVALLNELANTVKATEDSKLDVILSDIMGGGPAGEKATILLLNRVIDVVQDILK